MPNITSTSLFNIAPRFLRSTDLVRDFADPKALSSYVLTDFGRECFGRIARGLHQEPQQRAWRLTGDYGTGKSSFALLLAATFDGGGRKLPPSIRAEISTLNSSVKKADIVPVLVNGNRGRMGIAILDALSSTLERLFTRGAGLELRDEIRHALRSQNSLSDDQVLLFVERTKARIVLGQKGRGLLLILDELGKFLEFSAANPEKQDVLLLQLLAQSAARSGTEPLFVVCLLHQGFNAYADQLTQASQNEWEKVAGRFEEIVFRQPLDQIVSLIAAALGLDRTQVPVTDRSKAAAILEKALQLGWYGATSSRPLLRRSSEGIWPLESFLVPVLIRVFQRFGQNERSLFSFLFSYEPFGLRAYCDRANEPSSFFRLHNLFDYVRANLGHRLAVASYRSHWSTIEAAIESFASNDPTEIQILKTIGLLNLINADDLLATEEAVSWAVAGADLRAREQIATTLKRLKSRNTLFLRGAARGYALWSHSSIDIDARIEEAKRRVPNIAQAASVVRELLDTRPLVARRHYIETGNLRYFSVHYCSSGELMDVASESGKGVDADGRILVPLCETESERENAIQQAAKLKSHPGERIMLVAVPHALERLKGLLLERKRWEWISENTPELNSDAMARSEVSRYLQDSDQRLQDRVQDFIGLNRLAGRSALVWFHSGRRLQVESGREVLGLLSELAGQCYEKAPRVSNELVNRQTLSSSASAARMRLIELMLTRSREEHLGVPEDRRPPEISMYLSVLRSAGLHVKQKDGWQFVTRPDPDVVNVRPTLEFLEREITGRPDERVSIAKLFEVLRRPPFGIRDGLLPIFFSVVLIAREQELALYEDGTFVRELDKDIMIRLIKAPERFDVQYCRIEGVRSELFQRLSSLLELAPKGRNRSELMQLVKDLCQFVANLPEYTRNTKRLPKVAVAVRESILNAREPIRLVFHDLPKACGITSFAPGKKAKSHDAVAYANALKDALSALRMAHSSLEKRIEQQVSSAFHLGKMPLHQMRTQLAARASGLLATARETRLRTFCVRLADHTGGESDWIESIGSILAGRPPSKWKDEDEDNCEREIALLAGRFVRSEAVSHSTLGTSHAFRLQLTRANGEERESVVFADDSDMSAISAAEARVRAAIAGDERVGLLATSKVLWECLNTTKVSS